MATLIYATNVSLDGYIEDAHGAFDWAPPDDDVFAATTALMGGRQIRNDIEKLRRTIPEEPNSVPEAWQFLPPDSKSQNPMSG